jgi:hypothetical protein
MKAAPFVSFPQAVALAATFFDERRRLLEQVSDDQFQDAHSILQRVEAQRLCHFLDKRSEQQSPHRSQRLGVSLQIRTGREAMRQ